MCVYVITSTISAVLRGSIQGEGGILAADGPLGLG